MSLFGSLMGDLEDDSIFGLHMRSLRQMNNMMNSMMSDPFGMFRGLEAITGPSALTGQMNNRNSLMPFNFPDINTNRLLGAGGNNYYQQPDGGMSFSSSSYVSMTRGPDGRPQIYKATSSSKSGPGGIRETKKTVQDSRTGVSKMAIGQHIGERAHVVERQKNSHTGEEEETVDLINVDETDADEFNREFERKAREGVSSRRYGQQQQQQLAIAAPPTSSIRTTPQSKMTTQVPQHQQQQQQQYTHSNRRGLRNVLVTPRRHLRSPTSSLLALPSTSHSTLPTSVHPHPYNPTSRRHHRAMKGTQQQHQQQQQHQHQQQQQQHQHHQQQQHQQQHNNSTSGSGTR